MAELPINRRGFLRALISAPWVLLMGGGFAAAKPEGTRAVSLCRCAIAGFQYYQGQALLPTLVTGQTLVVQREPDNPHDPLAIAVHTAAGGKLGFLPRRLNEIPAALMDSGRNLTAVITDVDREAPPWAMVEVELRLG